MAVVNTKHSGAETSKTAEFNHSTEVSQFYALPPDFYRESTALLRLLVNTAASSRSRIPSCRVQSRVNRSTEPETASAEFAVPE